MVEIGVTQWFRFGRHDEVDRTLALLQELGVRRLRTAISWADWECPGGQAWIDWMVKRLYDGGLEIFPSFFYTPAERARSLPDAPRYAFTSYPPARLADYAEFCSDVVKRHGERMSAWCQIWNEPNNDAYWSPRHDPDHILFSEMALQAAAAFHASGKKVVLGGIIPPYGKWIRSIQPSGLLECVDAIGIHAFPGTWDKMRWQGWSHAIQLVRDIVPDREIWITETGCSAVTLEDQGMKVQKFRERWQIERFKEVVMAPADQAFWFSAFDQDPEHLTDNAMIRGTAPDPRAYYFGLEDRHGRRRPLFSYWRSLVREIRSGQGMPQELEAA